MIRAIVIDDVATVRQALCRLLVEGGEIEVAAEGRDGHDAVALTMERRPDIILMDVDMPRMDGLAATREIMATRATPILIVTSSAIVDARHLPFAAIEAGALDVFLKPDLTDPSAWELAGAQLRQAVRLLARVPVVHRRARKTAAPTGIGEHLAAIDPGWRLGVIVIGASTGGPMAIRHVLRELPPTFPVPIAIVQHIGDAFVPGLVEWLGHDVPLPVALARDRRPLAPGTVAVAPGGVHLRLAEGPVARFDMGPLVQHCRPAVDVLFHSAAQTLGSRAIGILLTGMGRDGADGLRAIHDAGGVTIAQDRESSIVYGMPGAAVDMGVVDHVCSPQEIGRWLASLPSASRRTGQ